ncbi:MAG: hypothetical protein B6245_14995 [Desulfobacteraceae bacterium 4572_88]|nr:MAG: hypothetical protein B6245_14995 [Desulfobacteraceae bacterium 4572_88]
MENSRKKVLVVDDDLSILRLLEDLLATDQHLCEVLTADSAEHAIDILSQKNVSVVVSDISMPGISGPDLLTTIRDRYPNVKVILITAYGSPTIREEGQRRGCLHFLEKPVRLEKLRQLIVQELREEEGFGGTLKRIQLEYLIQVFCMSPTSIAIRVWEGQNQGIIFVRKGKIIHALCGDAEGEQALYEILTWRSGGFETLDLMESPKTSISKSCEVLIMEGLRLADERAGILPETLPACMAYPDEPDLRPQLSCLRVLIVDDSPMMCRILTGMLAADEEIMVVGTAENGKAALEKIESLKPDVITLDVNMPVMDGRTTLKHIMIKNPCPVIILGAMSLKTSQTHLLDFLRFGAVDFATKPVKNGNQAVQQQELIGKVRQAARAKVSNFRRTKAAKVVRKPIIRAGTSAPGHLESLVIISSGAGGYSELMKIIPRLPGSLNTCLVVLQNMPYLFVPPLAEHFSERCEMDVLPLEENSELLPGRCYMGGSLSDIPLELAEIRDSGRPPAYHLRSLPPGTHGMDHFLMPVADAFADRALVLLLSGADVGDLLGLARIRAKNGRILAQRSASSMISDPLEIAIQARLPESEMRSEEMVRQILAICH